MYRTALVVISMLVLASCSSGDNDSKPPAAQRLPPPGGAAAASAPGANAPAGASAVAAAPNPDLKDKPLVQPSAETFKDGETVYVTAPYATMNLQGSFISLPIGTPVSVKAGSENACAWATGDSDELDPSLLCVYLEEYGEETDPGFPDATAVANRFGHNPPSLKGLLAEYDKTPSENKALRREWAEKAVALDPWSKEAHDRLMAVLNEFGDREAMDAEEDTFKRYQAHQPEVAAGELPTLFHYDGSHITPFVAIDHGVIKGGAAGSATRRGKFFQVYGDDPAGFIVTVRSVSCARCAWPLPVRNIGLDGKPAAQPLKGGYAANFPWPPRAKPIPAVTAQQKALLINALKKKTAADYGEAGAPAMERLDEGDIEIMPGQLSADGRIFLVGGLQIGSRSDEHYSNVTYISEWVVLEQQKDGSLIEVEADAAKLRENYCAISGTLRDLNGDGTDEIVTHCNVAVEGSGGEWSGILQRVNNRWVMVF